MEKVLPNITTDIMVSLGTACRPAQYMKEHGLRFLSCPLDWMMMYRLETVRHLFRTRFESFFSKCEHMPEEDGEKYAGVQDVGNGVVSIHHFPLNCSIDEFCVSEFQPMMKRRFKILDWFLKKSRNVVLLCNRLDSKEQLLATLQEFSELYPRCAFTMLVLRHVEGSRGCDVLISEFSKRMKMIEYFFDDTAAENEEEWLGNAKEWNRILSTVKFSLRSKILQKIIAVKRSGI